MREKGWNLRDDKRGRKTREVRGSAQEETKTHTHTHTVESREQRERVNEDGRMCK